MNSFFGYQFLLIILISSFTTFAQYFPDSFMNFEATENTANPMNIAKQRQQYYPLIPYWQAVDEAKINSINFPTDNYIEKGMIAREPHYSTLHRNGIRKRVVIGQMNDRASFAQSPTNIDIDNEYERKSPFQLFALNNARGFGK